MKHTIAALFTFALTLNAFAGIPEGQLFQGKFGAGNSASMGRSCALYIESVSSRIDRTRGERDGGDAYVQTIVFTTSATGNTQKVVEMRFSCADQECRNFHVRLPREIAVSSDGLMNIAFNTDPGDTSSGSYGGIRSEVPDYLPTSVTFKS